MELPDARGPRGLVRVAGLAVLWALAAAWMVWSGVHDPFDPSLSGTRRYGHNGEGALRDVLLLSLVELAVLYAIVQPWRAGRSWLRLAVALAFLAPWTLVSAVLSMHGGGVTMIHLVWLLAAGLALTVALALAALGALRRS